MPANGESAVTGTRPAVQSAILALAFHVAPARFGDSATAAIRARVENAMGGTGFTLVQAATAPHDVEVVVQTTARFERIGFSAYGRRVFVTVSLVGAGGVIDRMSVDYVESLPALDAATSRLLQAISASARLAEYAANVTQQRAAQVQAIDDARTRAAAAQQQAAEQAGKQQIDRDWYAIDVERCRVPRSLDACSDVRGFLAKYPDGAHADEAKAALATAAPRMEVLEKDEAAWTAADIDTCKRRVSANACARVEIYLAKYPAGLHANEARTLTQGAP